MKKENTNKFAALAIILISAIMLTGCGTKNSATESSSQQVNQPVQIQNAWDMGNAFDKQNDNYIFSYKPDEKSIHAVPTSKTVKWHSKVKRKKVSQSDWDKHVAAIDSLSKKLHSAFPGTTIKIVDKDDNDILYETANGISTYDWTHANFAVKSLQPEYTTSVNEGDSSDYDESEEPSSSDDSADSSDNDADTSNQTTEGYTSDEFNSQMQANLTAYDTTAVLFVDEGFASGHDDIYNIVVAQDVKYLSKSQKQSFADDILQISQLAFTSSGGTDSDTKPVIHIYTEDGTQIAHESVFSDVMKID